MCRSYLKGIPLIQNLITHLKKTQHALLASNPNICIPLHILVAIRNLVKDNLKHIYIILSIV